MGWLLRKGISASKINITEDTWKIILTFEDLQTILCENEHLINCRPIVYTSSDHVHETLTPFYKMFFKSNKFDWKRDEFSHEATNIKKMVKSL